MTQKDSQDEHSASAAGEPASPPGPSSDDDRRQRTGAAGPETTRGQADQGDDADALGAVVPARDDATPDEAGGGSPDLPWPGATDVADPGRFRPGSALEPQFDAVGPADSVAQDATGREIMDRAERLAVSADPGSAHAPVSSEGGFEVAAEPSVVATAVHELVIPATDVKAEARADHDSLFDAWFAHSAESDARRTLDEPSLRVRIGERLAAADEIDAVQPRADVIHDVSRGETASRQADVSREGRVPERDRAGEIDEPVSHHPEPIVVRTPWQTPPPLVETPPWVWRDVVPDIVSRRDDVPPPESDLTEQAAPGSHEPGFGSPEPVQLEPAPSPQPAPQEEREFRGDSRELSGRHSAHGEAYGEAPLPLRPEPEPAPSPSPQPSLQGEGGRGVEREAFVRADAVEARHRSEDPPAPAPSLHETDAPQVKFEAPSQAHAEASRARFEAPMPPAFEVRHDPAWKPERARPGFQHVPSVDDLDSEFRRAPPQGWERAKDIGRTALRYAAYAVGGYFALVMVLILVYRFVNPPASSLMIVQALTGTDVEQQWVPLDEISPALIRAVIVSEDWAFCEHYGIDIKAIEQAIERSGNGIPAGASTISMQTTKNLFLWNARSYIRKAVELPLTLMIELIWPKDRILEIYLNVAEWGPGIFGAEAAAQYHFNKPAARLGEREAAQLAASLPNPIIREAGDPGPRTARKASVIQSRMRNAGDAAQCVLGR